MAKPMITGDGPSVRAALIHGEHVYLCRRADPAALAQAISTLCADPELRHRLAENGHSLFLARYNLVNNGRCYARYLQELLSEANRAA